MSCSPILKCFASASTFSLISSFYPPDFPSREILRFFVLLICILQFAVFLGDNCLFFPFVLQNTTHTFSFPFSFSLSLSLIISYSPSLSICLSLTHNRYTKFTRFIYAYTLFLAFIIKKTTHKEKKNNKKPRNNNK